ncbi:MAG TPA: hypothetical protein VGP78_03555, partial [Solirubrobacteraceae bacterium]|nr:hypothetical protein [Solirubrobacteraceae bacterium]
TSPDGTAVRADVRDNGFAFLVPRRVTMQPRYVVWTGADGTPHVQPVASVALGRGACAGGRLAARPRVTPGAGCAALPALLPAGARRRPGRPVAVGPCFLLAAPVPVLPRRARPPRFP